DAALRPEGKAGALVRTVLKLGPGGLRDVEFSAQLLQLVHGTEDHDIREPNTLEALRSLERGGYLSGDDAALMEEAYSFLR
ncbi:hypothetical protein CJ199_13150, partial [Brevibacterium paucivorans]